MDQKLATVKAQENNGDDTVGGSATAESIRLELADAWGEMGASWGVTPAIARVQAYLMADAGDIRYRLVNQLLREGAKRGAARFHVACADVDGNVELMMQAGFIRYGEEMIMSTVEPGGTWQ